MTTSQVSAWAFAIAALSASLLAWCCYFNNQGLFSFTLDDPYIHLALAENLLHGHYGVNTQDYSAPSSSIGYPWLLLPGFWLGMPELWPLLLNILSVSSVAALFAHWLSSLLPHSPKQIVAIATGVPLLAFGLLALPMTGMEHGPQVLFTCLAFLGLLKAAEGQRAPFWLPFTLLGCVAMRFEGLALACTAIAALLYWRQRWAAMTTAAMIGALLTAHLSYMSYLGLPLLPSSILSKSAWAANAEAGGSFANSIARMLANLLRNASYATVGEALTYAGTIFLVLSIGAFARRNRKKERRISVLWLLCAATIFAHLFAGSMGGFSRYEIYVVALSGAGLLVACKKAETQRQQRIIALLLVMFILSSAPRYLYNLSRVPEGSRNVVEQQYAMHRFAAEFYDAPVAVNDLGWVSFRNPNYVLDLYGLASEEARKGLRDGDAGYAQRLTGKYAVGVVMIYEDWFRDEIPGAWRRAGQLRLSGTRASVGGDTVQFFVTPYADSGRVERAFAQMRRQYPHTFFPQP